MSVRNDIMDSLISAIDVIRTSSSYEAQLGMAPVAYHENYLTKFQSQTPLLMAVDQGNEQVLSQSATKTMYAFDVMIYGYVKGHSWDHTQEKLNAVVASVKQWVNSGPSLGAAVLALQFGEGSGHDFRGDTKEGHTAMRLQIIYKVTNGTY